MKIRFATGVPNPCAILDPTLLPNPHYTYFYPHQNVLEGVTRYGKL